MTYISKFITPLALACLVHLNAIGFALAQEACPDADQQLASAETYYYNGRLQEAIDALTPCLPQFRREKNWQAYRLLALTYYAANDKDRAEEYIRILVKDINPRYQISEEDPIFFREKIEAYKPKRWYQKPWIWVSGGAAAAGLAGFAILFDPQPHDLPRPPDDFLPTR